MKYIEYDPDGQIQILRGFAILVVVGSLLLAGLIVWGVSKIL